MSRNKEGENYELFFKFNKNVDKVIIAIVIVLAAVSILMIGSTQISAGFFTREVIVQCIAYFIGVVGILIILRFNYNMFEGMEKFLYILSLVLVAVSIYAPWRGTVQCSLLAEPGSYNNPALRICENSLRADYGRLSEQAQR